MTGHFRRDESGVALGLAVILVVVRSDLEGTIQMNRGGRALHLADAVPGHYDADGADNTGWAYVPPDGGTPGETLALGEGAVTTTIRYLIPAKTAAQQRDGRYAPERVPAGLPDYPGRDFFLAVSEGSSGGTRRKVEVIFYAKASGDSHEVVQWSWREVYK